MGIDCCSFNKIKPLSSFSVNNMNAHLPCLDVHGVDSYPKDEMHPHPQ